MMLTVSSFHFAIVRSLLNVVNSPEKPEAILDSNQGQAKKAHLQEEEIPRHR